MIRLDNVSKSFRVGKGRKYIARNLTVTFPTGASVALLGRNGAGKSTLMAMIGGHLKPDQGNITSTGTISWPVGFAGSFNLDTTGSQNTRFLARLYGVDTDELAAFVEDFSELGAHFHEPIRSYSSGMRSRLAFGISVGIPFDTYLVDEVTSVGDASFRRKSRLVFRHRMETSGCIFVSHNMHEVREFCDSGVVLEKGQATFYSDLDEAIDAHQSDMR